MAVFYSAAPEGPRFSQRFLRPQPGPDRHPDHAPQPSPTGRAYTTRPAEAGYAAPQPQPHLAAVPDPVSQPRVNRPAQQVPPRPVRAAPQPQYREQYRDPYQQHYDEQYAEPEVETYGEEPEVAPLRLPGIGAIANIAGGVLSLGVIIAVGVWGYGVMTRDVSGVPVVRALEGAMREAPAEPGGQPMDHQGLAVNRVAADGIAAPTADRLVLAPPPASLDEEDLPPGALAAASAAPPVVETQAIDAGQPIETLTDGDAPLDGEEATALADAEPPLAETPYVKILPASVPGIVHSLRPRVRPATLMLASASGPSGASAIDAAVAAAGPVDVAVSSITPGTRLVQLGAFESPEIARAEWDRLNARYGDYLEGKGRVIQKAESGGRTFYRLRAMGFEDLSDARRFCSAMVAEGAACIPVTVR